MRKLILFFFIFQTLSCFSIDTLSILNADTVCFLDKDSVFKSNSTSNIYRERIDLMNSKTPMDLVYNEKVQTYIDSYLGRDKLLVAKMKGLAELYFPLFEQYLDMYNLPLELKYLAIVESALNPKAKSSSGAMGLWQFMYLTGKQYGLTVNSYIDERQDPIKSTKAACLYFEKLYDIFGDWNLVLAAYNGGPGYLQRKISSVETYDFWKLHPHLRSETRNYIPKFIAINYVMSYATEHDIEIIIPNIEFGLTDTLTIKKQCELKVLSEITCVNKETITYLNPSYKKGLFPSGALLRLPAKSIIDFIDNEEANYSFIDAVKDKEILIDEERIVYTVEKGDYLGRIAKLHNVRIFEIKDWNNLTNTNLDVGDKLVIYVKKEDIKLKNEYIVKKGDTLWGIAKKYNGLSIKSIKLLNNLESDYIKPGTKILLPTT